MKRFACIVIAVLSSNIGIAQEFNPHDFSFNGYLRTGFGKTNGAQMVDFKTPEIDYKFRMGNEANHYGELQFNYKYMNQDSTNQFGVSYMMSKYSPYGDANLNNFPETAQLYGTMYDVYKNGDVWIGKRYYQRKNVEMLDYFWLNSAQGADVGFGIEGVELAPNKGNINLAFIQFNYAKDLEQSYSSYTADFRYLDLPISKNSTLNFLGQYGYIEKNDVLNLPKHNGYALGTWWTYKNNNIENTSTAIYRKGSTITDSPYSGKTISEYRDDYRLYDLDHAHSFNFVENFVYDDKEKHALQGTIAYRYTNYGIGNVNTAGIILDYNTSKNDISIGFRYMYYLNKRFNLAIEAGNDYMKSSKLGLEGNLQKITFSPQITWDYGYYTRPVIRPFITYAQWSDDFKGLVGVNNMNHKLLDKTRGLSYGIQLEIWW